MIDIKLNCGSTLAFSRHSGDSSFSLIMSSDGMINPLFCPRCVFDPDSKSIANRSRQSMSRRMRSHNQESKKVKANKEQSTALRK